jgi:hypothetical protein
MNILRQTIFFILVNAVLVPAGFAIPSVVPLSVGPGKIAINGSLTTADALGVEVFPGWGQDYSFHFDLFELSFTEDVQATITVTPSPSDYFIPWVNLFPDGAIDTSAGLQERVVWLNGDTGYDLYALSVAAAYGFTGTSVNGSMLHPATFTFAATAGTTYQLAVTSYDYYDTNDPEWAEWYNNSGPALDASGYPVLGEYEYHAQIDRFTYAAALGSYELVVDAEQELALLRGAVGVPAPPTVLLLLFGIGFFRFFRRDSFAAS